MDIETPADAYVAAEKLRQQHNLEAVLITLDRDGMALVEAASCRFPSPSSILDPRSSSSLHLPTTPREVYDITGAGDMVLAALGLCLAARIPLPQAAQLANIAAGLEVERLGVSPITREELRAALPPLGRGGQGGSHCLPADSNTASDNLGVSTHGTNVPGSPKINPKSEIPIPKSVSKLTTLTTLPDLLPVLTAYRNSRKRIAFTNGCFDLLHIGHVTYLQQAAELGDVLIVAVNSDASVRQLKGQGRPVISERDRALILASLGCVDHVVIFDEPTNRTCCSETIRPDILVKGGNYSPRSSATKWWSPTEAASANWTPSPASRPPPYSRPLSPLGKGGP